MSTPALVTPPAPIAYSVKDAAAAVGVSVRKLESLIQSGDLNVRYVGSKRVLSAAELHAWIESLPYERGES